MLTIVIRRRAQTSPAVDGEFHDDDDEDDDDVDDDDDDYDCKHRYAFCSCLGVKSRQCCLPLAVVYDLNLSPCVLICHCRGSCACAHVDFYYLL